MRVFRTLSLAVGFAALLSGAVFGANQDHIARAKDSSQIAECVRCDLSGADMSRGFFHFANFYESNLAGSKFDAADMAGVLLMNAKLTGGSFVYTNLSGAQLNNADLSGANLTNAWLNHAQLTGAKLGNANLTGAKLRGAQLQGADLSQVVGLEQSQLELACRDLATKLPKGIRVTHC